MSEPLAIVVEDEAALRVIYERILRSVGYNVILAADGQQGIDFLSIHSPNIVFLDMLLPYVNGLDVLSFALEQPHLAETYIVVVSSAKEYERYVRDTERVEFMQKPVLPTEIREIARRILGAEA